MLHRSVRRSLILFFVPLLGLGRLGMAAGVADCAEFMRFGIYDQFNTLNDEQQFSEFKHWVRTYENQRYESALSDAKTLGLDTGLFSVTFGSRTAQNNFSEWVRAFEQSTFESFARNASFRQSIRQVNAALMSVVSECIKSQSAGTQYAWIETSRDRSRFTFMIRYVPDGENAFARVDSVGVVPVQAIASCPQYTTFKNTVHKLQTAVKGFTCPVSPADTITVTVVTDKGTVNPTLEGYSPPQPKPTPRIAVTSSYHRESNGNCAERGVFDAPTLGFSADVYGVAQGTQARVVVRSIGAASGGYPAEPGTSIEIDGKPHAVNPAGGNVDLVNHAELVLVVEGVEVRLAEYWSSAACPPTQELHFPGAQITLTRRAEQP